MQLEKGHTRSAEKDHTRVRVTRGSSYRVAKGHAVIERLRVVRREKG